MSYNILSITSILLATLVALATYPFRSICQNCARIDMTFGLAILALQGDSHRLRTLLRSTQNQKKHFSPPPMHVQMKCLILGISKPCRPCPPCVHPSKHLLESLTHLAEAMPTLGWSSISAIFTAIFIITYIYTYMIVYPCPRLF